MCTKFDIYVFIYINYIYGKLTNIYVFIYMNYIYGKLTNIYVFIYINYIYGKLTNIYVFIIHREKYNRNGAERIFKHGSADWNVRLILLCKCYLTFRHFK
jgi:hypothetical protein